MLELRQQASGKGWIVTGGYSDEGWIVTMGMIEENESKEGCKRLDAGGG